MSGKYEKPTYLTINVKYKGKFRTMRIYEYYITPILNFYTELNSFKIEKEQKSFLTKYVQNLIDNNLNSNGDLFILDNFNFTVNSLIFKDIYYSLKNKNREQKSFDF